MIGSLLNGLKDMQIKHQNLNIFNSFNVSCAASRTLLELFDISIKHGSSSKNLPLQMRHFSILSYKTKNITFLLVICLFQKSQH
jgi:hypothetical protein